MYPKNIANAILTPAEAAELAERHMQMAPHPSFVPRRAVMHQPQAVIPRLPHGYMHTASASNPASTQAEQLAAAAKTARNVQSKLEENAAHALQAAQAAAEAAERAAQQTAAEASEWASRQAAAEAAERASRQAVLKEAEKSAKQTAVEIAKRIAQQAAVETAERIAQQAAVETAERIAQQAAVETAERITRQAAAETAERITRQAAAEETNREARLAAVETAERVAQQTAAEAAKRAAVEMVERKARQAAVETVRRVVRQAANKAAERTARYAALKEAAQVTQQAAVEAAEQAARQATVEAEEQAAQQAALKAEEQATRQAVVASVQRVVQQTANKAAERAARFAALKEATQVARQAAVDAAEQAAQQAAVEEAEKAARQAAVDAVAQAARQAAVDAAEQAARQAAVDAAEQAARQAAVGTAEQAARQAAVDAAEQAARQAAVDAAEQAARQAAVDAAKIDEAAAQTMSSEPSAQVAEAQEQIVEAVTQAVPQKIVKQAAQALQAELPPASAQAVVKTLEEKSALAQKSHIHKQSAAPVEESAPQAVPAAAKSALQTAPVAESASESQTALATAAPMAVPPVSVPAESTFGLPATLHFCTVAGSSYLFKVATLYRSLEAYSNDFMLYICCIDDETLAAMEKLHLPRCIAVSVDALNDSGLAALRSQRSASEFCWTLKSHLLLWLLTEKRLPEAVYLDSDVAFFSDPKQLYDDWGNASVYLCRQRDLDWVEQKYGKYQAGVIGFKNDEQGVAAVRWWRDKCRAWCFAAPDTGQYGDQKYLDDIPALFRSVRISTHRGIDAAPWNTVYNNNYPISVSGNEIRIDGDPLVAYHFACLDVIDEQHFDLWNLSGISIGQTISNAIYVPYLAKLRESIAEVHAKTGGRYYARKTFGDARTPYIYSDNNLSISHWDGMYGFCTIASKQYAARTLALYNSLENHAGNFHIWICCMDDTAYAILSAFNLGNATLVKVSDVETEEAKATRASKKLYEYCWTMKPLLCQHVFQNYNISRLIYCDADMYFFASPQAIHNEWRRYETYLNLQRGSAQLEAVHGMYQAGLIGFSKAAESLRTLNWWAQQCTAWCYDNHDDHSRWGDQKYLTQMPNLFASIKVNNRYGLLAAPWNIVMNNSKDLPVHTDEGGTVWIGDEALTCFHFGSINVLSESEYDLWKLEPLNFDPAIIESIYKPYLAHLRSIYGEIRGKGFDTSGLFESGAGAQNSFTLEG